jgi:hypothetical protein
VGERKEVAGCSTADRCGEGSKDVAAEIGEEQITRLACRGGEEKEMEREVTLVGNCCWLWIWHN